MFSDRKFLLTSPHPELEQLINENNGSVIAWKDRFVREITPQLVIVSDNIDFESYDELNAMMVPVVTAQWVHDSISAHKIAETRPYSPDPRQFMRSVTICIANLSPGDTEGFKAGISAAGGTFTNILTTVTTHVIATDANNEIVATARESGHNIKIVSPEWFDDCMKLGRKVDEVPYFVIPTDAQRAKSGALSPTLLGTFNATEPSDTSVPQKAIECSVRKSLGSTVFSGRQFYLGTDLEISNSMKKHIHYLIEANEGQVAESLEEANTYLGKWRQGDEYIFASKKRFTVGNLLWLYWMAMQQKWESPIKHLLHYPEVPGGLPDFKDKVICITNYTGEARNYLRTLITALGATYTGTMCQTTNTHLVAAYGQGPKYEAAQNWGIHIVNHLWLEDSYAKWMVLDANLPRYQYLPKRLDLTTLIGTTALSTAVLRQFYTVSTTPLIERHLPARKARDKAQHGVHRSVLKEHLFRKQMTEPVPDADQTPQREREKRKERDDKIESEAVVKPSEDVESAVSKATPAPSKATTPQTTPKPKATAKPLKNHEASTPSSLPTSTPKRQKLDTLRVMMTSVDDIKNKQKLSKLGIRVVETGTPDILIAPKILKTQKFLMSLSEVSNIVTPKWLTESIKKGERLDPKLFQLKDAAGLIDKRRNLPDERLFGGIKFKLSTSVRGGVKVVEQIVKAHGGKVVRKLEDGIIYVRGDDEKHKSPVTLDVLIQAVLAMDPQVVKS